MARVRGCSLFQCSANPLIQKKTFWITVFWIESLQYKLPKRSTYISPPNSQHANATIRTSFIQLMPCSTNASRCLALSKVTWESNQEKIYFVQLLDLRIPTTNCVSSTDYWPQRFNRRLSFKNMSYTTSISRKWKRNFLTLSCHYIYRVRFSLSISVKKEKRWRLRTNLSRNWNQ